MGKPRTIICGVAVGILMGSVRVNADSPRLAGGQSSIDKRQVNSDQDLRPDPATIHTRGTVEAFVYLPRGYGPTVPVSSERPNVSSYGLNISTELRSTRQPRVLLFTDALLLMGDSNRGNEVSDDLRPTTILGRYGIGAQLRPGVQLRLTHGEGYDINHVKTTGAPWNSVSVRLQRTHSSAFDQYAEVYFYPPHNEFDPSPTGPFSQRVVARYGVQFAKKVTVSAVRRLIVFTEPLLLFGDSRPQISYNYSARPLAVRLAYGAGLCVTPWLQLRFNQGEWRNLGGYRGRTQFWNGLSLRYGW
jgi:hypothetical protein